MICVFYLGEDMSSYELVDYFLLLGSSKKCELWRTFPTNSQFWATHVIYVFPTNALLWATHLIYIFSNKSLF
jgi:hypothetical protein